MSENYGEFTPERLALLACARAWVEETPDAARMETVSRVAAEIRAAEERGRRAEHERAQGVIHVLHQCIRGKCACEDNGAISQFACEETARKAIDAWDLAPRDSGKEG